MALAAGTRLGPYEILAPIDAGGMGEVYKARDTRLDRIVAVKVSKTEFSERFEREARAIATLNHSHICQLYDVGPNYLVMEYIEGAPLKGPLPLDQTLKYAAQICDALDAAHKKNIIHRDLKPANILVTKTGIKLLDFGLAKTGPAVKAGEGTMTMALTGKGEMLGTSQYMSPEQINGQDAGPQSDIFSFGLVLYEMLTGKRAFDGATPASVIAAILERPTPSVGDVAPPALDRVLKRCLEKDPENRWQSARDLKAELEWMAQSAPAQAPPLGVSAMAYVLVCGLRRLGLQATELATAQAATIRLRLLKIGALVRVTVRRVWISLPRSYPWPELFARVHHALTG
jgi:serine/threonine protein kinase